MSITPNWGGASTRDWVLWSAAVLAYGVGDGATTVLGLQSHAAAEVGPVALFALEHAGIGGLVVLKAGFLGCCFLAWSVLGSPIRSAIPLALGVVGVFVTGWNLLALFG